MSRKMTFCQCCLTNKNKIEFRSMLKEYIYNETTEIYHDILYDCLSIQIATPLSDPDDFLICLECVEKLRNILLFKEQINENQNKLAKLQQDSVYNDEVYIKEELSDGESNIDYLEDGEYYEKPEEKKFKIKNEVICSSDILKKALERTKKNLQLLNASEKTTLDANTNELGINYDSGPEDKRERKRYLDRKRYARRIPITIEKTDRICKVCGEKFPTNKSLVSHMAEHYPNHICNYCGKLFILKNQLQRHVSATHSNVKVSCPTCHKLVKKDSLRRHINSHTDNKYAYQCSYCPEKFVAYSTKINHMYQKHGYKGNEYKCKVCSKVFKVSSELSVHLKSIHFGEKNHKCNQCEKCFYSKYRLKMHMIKHTQEKNYECNICQKKYGRRYTLNEHMKIHNNVKNHVCDFCNRAFTQKCTLLCHLKTHEK